ncbi:FtsX-like permease family protein [Pseudonocardia broussonetiae]|uniref:ABC transporter permease n=1 Tax=Pseudonocardia broussonetiae TaxID=2736640 RepID=A0A6M6JH19_9PSEU|nr:FtsX-like permease family protein [Pseudonocardia broussonetiae]QJY46217.1 ABC transporter permease [Pseudonocardia broussonetiae]
MIAVARLSLRLLRLGGRRAALAAGLVGAGVAVGTVLLSLALGGIHGWDAREERTGWRADLGQRGGGPPGEPVALAASRTEHAAGRSLQVVDLAVTAPGTPPPPGLPRVPGPGEVWTSPALAALLRELPPDALADRFPAAPTGLVTDAGLAGPDELVAVVGAAADDPALADADALPGFAPTAGFGTIEVHRQLTYVAAALLVFPVASLLGASARLTAARRTERLALLRLLGASTRQVTVAAVTEVTAVATVAAVLGVVLYAAASPAVARIELGGGAWFTGDVLPSPSTLLLVVAGVALLATGAAVGGMRQVVVGPLGVVRRQRAGGARLLRLAGAAAGLVAFAVVNLLRDAGPANVTGIVFGVGVLIMFGTVALLGPLVVRLLGNGMVRTARSAPALLAGRRLLDDPKAAFRPLAGLVLAVFVAGFLAPLTSALSEGGGDDTALRVPSASAAAVADRLTAAGLVAAVEPDGDDVLVTPADDRDRVRTALAPLVPGEAVATAREASATEAVFVGDLRRGTLVVLAGTFLLAATATGTAAAARILDQRRALRLLRLAGTPLGVLDAARRAATVRPLLVLGGIGLAAGLLCASPFAAAVDALAPSGLLLLGGVVVVGVLLVVAASAASRPLLRSVTTGAARED